MSSKYPRRASRHELPILLMAALLLVAFITCFVQPMAAQESRGTVRGTVTDPSHAVVPNAKVTLRNVNSNVESSLQTDSGGFYIFNFVIPGIYSVTVEATGFQKYVQENVLMQTANDVTVNPVLVVGAVTQTVEVTAQVAAVTFNTSQTILTVPQNILRDITSEARNPFTMALLDAAVVNNYADDRIRYRLPYYMWSDSELNVGGRTTGRNELLLDGATLNISSRGSYTPNIDSVQELTIQQNPTDAEYGFSAGATVNLSLKPGTNAFHGTAFFLGRNPALMALSNRTTRTPNVERQADMGGSLGNPVIKNKLFNFFSFEKWITNAPSTVIDTQPTDLEKTGDFSQALTPQGKLRVIYDPMSTVFDPVTNTVTRTPFPNNVIPANRIDPTAAKVMPYIWGPNGPGDSLDGVNNYKSTHIEFNHYWNISDRVDYNINDHWRAFARYSAYQARIDTHAWGDGSIATPAYGTIMDAMNAAGDLLWLPTPRTAVNFRYGATYVEDEMGSARKSSVGFWGSLWPNNPWYSQLLIPAQGIYFPAFNFNGVGTSQVGDAFWYLVHGRDQAPVINVTHERGKHHLKFGWQLRYIYDQNQPAPGPGSMNFASIDTGRTFLSDYDAGQSGDPWASFLLGSVNSGSARIVPGIDMREQQWTFYGQDDLKLTSRITLNLGLRWERETAPLEEQRHLVKTLDLTNPIPELQGFNIWGPQQIAALPANALSLQNTVYNLNGAMIYTNNAQPRMYAAPWRTFLPRIGIALRLDDNTAFRMGYTRWAIPWSSIHAETGGLALNGYQQTTNVLPPLQGIPRMFVSNPYPTTGPNANPVLLPVGNSLGRYQDLGNSINSFWVADQMHQPMNDRVNFTLQRQEPHQILTEITFITMFDHNAQDLSANFDQYYNDNQIDPNLTYAYKGLVDTNVPNPFYMLLPANKMPGALRLQPTVPLRQLLLPYPAYGSTLNQAAWPGEHGRQYNIQVSAKRPMTNGLSFLASYNYFWETHTYWFNDEDTYNNKFTMMDPGNFRHIFRLAGTYQLPFGRGRRYLSNAPRVVDAIVGGWETSQIAWVHTGALLMFPPALVTADPTQNIPKGYYFNATGLAPLPSYTPRLNPWYYKGLRGIGYWDIDSDFSKNFKLTERVKFELRGEFYNLTNRCQPQDPDMTIGDGTTGLSTAQWNTGREFQYSAYIRF